MCDTSMSPQWEPLRLFDGEYFVYRGRSSEGGREGTGTYTTKGEGQSTKGGSGNTNNRDSSSSPQKPSWATMEGPVYLCDYMGYKTLNKPATSIAGLQPTVKDLYLQFRKTLQQGNPPKKSSFKITPGGLLISLHESGGPLEMFFDITSINLIQAVRFAILKGSEKKPKAVFVPLADSRVPTSSDKSAFSLDKSFHFLVHASHQPLLVCVLRRPKGVKALDCHVFGMDSPDNVLYVQSCVHQLMESGGSAAGEGAFNRSSTRGDFIRTEFGDYNVYRGGQEPLGMGRKYELKDEHFRGSDGGGGGFPPQLDPVPGPRGGGQPSPRETYPAESSDRPRFGWSYDKPQGGEDFRRIPGQYGGDAGRPVSGELRPAGSQYYSDNRGANQYPGDRRSGELAEDRAGFRSGSGYNQGYRLLATEYERSEVSHARERSGDSGDNRVTGLSRKVSTGSDHSGGGGGGRRYDDGGVRGGGGPQDSRFGPVSPRSEAPPKVMEKPVSPVRVTAGPAFSPSNPPGHAPLSPRLSAEPPRPPSSPYSPSGPPPGGAGPYNDGPAFSLSNRENRADEADQEAPAHGKPVAKVPPHLKGVKVLPSDFRAVKLKPKQQRAESEESDHGYDNQKNIMAQYKQLQLQEQEAQQGFTGFDDRDPDKPSNSISRSYSSNWNDDARTPSESVSGYEPQYRRFAGDEERRYIEQYSDQDTMQMRPPGRYDGSPMISRNRPSSSGNKDSDSGAGHWRSKTAYDMGPGQRDYPPRSGGITPPSSAANDDKQMGRKKDAEIASMFSNYCSQGRQDAFNPDRNNFEQSLGYLP